MSTESLKEEDCETVAENTDSVASDIYLLKDPPVKDEDEQANSDSLDAGSDDLDSAKQQIQRRTRCRHRCCGLAVVFAIVVGIFVVAAVVVVVTLSVTSLQHLSQEPSGWEETVPTTEPSRPVVRISVPNGCFVSVIGTVEKGMHVYKGIPYAMPPTGKLRWHQPVPFVLSDNDCMRSIDASHFGHKCMQLETDGQTISGTENCLFMNVWTHSGLVNSGTQRNVFVYIHSGGLMTGSGNEPDTIPTYELLHESDAIFVSFNYRLNAFGFLALEALTSADGFNSSGNYGLMDQILALQWVQQNIRAFGGNPSNVTVFGYGSGATSIYALLASDLARGLFHRAWLSNPSAKLQSNRQEAEKQNSHFVNDTGCADENHNPVSETSCLRSLAAETVIRALPWQQWQNDHFYRIPTSDETSVIIVTVDGFVLKYPPLLAWQKKSFVDVPLLISSAAQATDLLKLNDMLQYNYADYVNQRLMSFSDVDIEPVYELYGIHSADLDPELCDATLVSDMRATCPIDEMARVAANASRSPVYRYQITYHSTAHNSSSKNYAYIGIDVHAFFNSANKNAPTWMQFVRNVRATVMDIVHFGSVQNWQPFPLAAYSVSDTVVKADAPRFQSEQCKYWRDNGFFPAYAWMN